MKTKSVKQAEAIARNIEWAKLLPQHQLAYLDKHGFVAKKQRAKLAKVNS